MAASVAGQVRAAGDVIIQGNLPFREDCQGDEVRGVLLNFKQPSRVATSRQVRDRKAAPFECTFSFASVSAVSVPIQWFLFDLNVLCSDT